MRPAQALARGGHLVAAQRRAVRALGVLLVRRAVADDGARADQGRLVGVNRGRHQRGLDRLRIVAVDVADHLPAVGLEARRRVVAEPARRAAVDADPVVVPDRDQLAELEGAGQRAGLVRDAFHETSVAEEDVGHVVNHAEARPVEALCQHFFGQRHAHRVGEPLPQRAGRGLDAGEFAGLRMTGGLGVQLAEALDLVERENVARQVQQRVQQH